MVVDLEKSQQMASSLEERMKQSENERRALEEARLRAEEARRMAEEAAHLEKEERERMVMNVYLPFLFLSLKIIFNITVFSLR